jgi:hypothetical protein
LLQDAMRRVEQARDATQHPPPMVLVGVVLDRSDAAPEAGPPQGSRARVPLQKIQPRHVPPQQVQPRETSTTGTGGTGW